MSTYQSPLALFLAKWIRLAGHHEKAPYHQVSRSWGSLLRLWNILTVWHHIMAKVRSFTFRGVHLRKSDGLLVGSFTNCLEKGPESHSLDVQSHCSFLFFCWKICPNLLTISCFFSLKSHQVRVFILVNSHLNTFSPLSKENPLNYREHAPLITCYSSFQPHHLMLKASEVRRDDMMQCITTRERNLIQSIHCNSLRMPRRHPSFSWVENFQQYQKGSRKDRFTRWFSWAACV